MKHLPQFSLSARLLGVVVFATLFPGCQKEIPAPTATPPRPVSVATVTLTTDQPAIEAAGVLVRKLEPTLAFKVGGIVAEVAVRAGETVRRGQVLARLDPAEIDAQAAQAQSALLKARRDAERLARLQAERVATLEQLQNARTGVEVAEAQLRVVDFNRRFATITAPADGRVLRRHAEPGELVAPGQPVITFGAEAEGWVFRASVSERDVRRLSPGDPAVVGFRGPPPATLAAVVAQIAEAADPQTRTFELELTVPENPAGLRSGAVGTLTILKPAAVARPRVPLAALLEGQGRTAFLFELGADGHTVRRRPVEIELMLGDSALLATPLAAGTRLVTAGAEYLRDGDTVVVAAPR